MRLMHRQFIRFCVASLCPWPFFLISIISGCNYQTASETERTAWLTDVTAGSAIDFVHIRADRIRYWLPEIMSGGAAWIDFDSDGDLDLYLVQGGHLALQNPNGPGNVLYENQGDGTFRDVTQRAGVGDWRYGMGATVADYDGDGHEDIYVTNVGNNVLYRNHGDGTFEDVTEGAGVGHDGWGSSAAFVDYDADGNLDLIVVNYIHWSPEAEIECKNNLNQRDYCTPKIFQAPAADVLYHNRGDGTFQDVSRAVGLTAAYGNGLGIAVGDFNLDDRLDFYVANDGNANQLWLQDRDGRFQDHALMAGCAVNRLGAAEAGMGVAPVDLDHDGDLDLFMTHLGDETNTLYVNDDGQFDDSTALSGLAAPSISYTGFGLGFADFDHDGRLDLYVANGRVGRGLAPLGAEDPFAEPNQLFRGVGGRRFEEVMPRGGTQPGLIENSRAMILGDYDRDGDIDLLVVNNGGPVRLLANQAGTRGNWIRFRVLDKTGRHALGARIRIEVEGQVQWRMVQRAYSYLGSNEPEVHFGLGKAKQAENVTVIWPGKKKEKFGSFVPGQVHRLFQGRGASQL